MPERLCGGTFRTRRGRKRKRDGVKKEEGLSYVEQRQRRIERKFGKDGKLLGGEEEARVKLENGRKPKGKPRVAGSARGRELRAAAALARFGAQKEEEVKKEEAPDTDSGETESGSDLQDAEPEKEALDLNGSKLLDSKGRGMVKVCEDEDQDDVYVKQEMDELHNLTHVESHEKEPAQNPEERTGTKHQNKDRNNPHGTDHTRTISETVSKPIKQENTYPAPSPSPKQSEPQLNTPTIHQQLVLPVHTSFSHSSYLEAGDAAPQLVEEASTSTLEIAAYAALAELGNLVPECKKVVIGMYFTSDDQRYPPDELLLIRFLARTGLAISQVAVFGQHA
ncbi:MAG: hypothetical protein Q9216_006358 [Gyalolechia sp. 2 TL-2023]